MVQSRLDYCSQLWSPSDQASTARQEGVARTYTRQIQGMEGLDYVERLRTLKMYSQERRRERYKIIFIWKVGIGMVQGYNLPFIRNLSGSPRSKTVQITATRPQVPNKVDIFKNHLNLFLAEVPYEPIVPERQRAATTNSQLDWLAIIYN